MPNPSETESIIKNKIIGSIDLVIREVFSNYFGVSVFADDAADANLSLDGKEVCLCQVHMKQDGINMFLCFSFDANLLYRLVDEAYGGEAIADLEPYNDAACEIANVVCCRVKSILNENGYHLNMEIPYTGDETNKFVNLCDAVNLHFSANDGGGFFVNLFTSEQV